MISRPAISTARMLTAGALTCAFAGIAIVAFLTARTSPLLPLVEACCLGPLVALVAIELQPPLATLRFRRRTVQVFRRQLAELPEVPEPARAQFRL